eukprot:TRINITY_DN195_c2_g2_i7.p1 TRINITY_DN195_c2_g2~~TRINITY_DN195_c2_g2_i7.p1  ORF type:complete len:168 (+),score=2.27 TRINITY_DN195_c2_g2_i7:50-553(+)
MGCTPGLGCFPTSPLYTSVVQCMLTFVSSAAASLTFLPLQDGCPQAFKARRVQRAPLLPTAQPFTMRVLPYLPYYPFSQRVLPYRTVLPALGLGHIYHISQGVLCAPLFSKGTIECTMGPILIAGGTLILHQIVKHALPRAVGTDPTPENPVNSVTLASYGDRFRPC